MLESVVPFVVRHIDALIPAAIGCIFWLQGTGILPFSRNQEKNRFLLATKGASLRRAGIGLFAIGAVLGLAASWRRPRLANPTEAAASLAAKLGENLPQVIDEVTTLEKVNAAGEFLTMEFRLPHHTLVEMAPSAAAIREDVEKAVCDSELKRMMAIGVTINYVYYSADSQVVTQFSLDEAACKAQIVSRH